jgi:hypothetical protein
MTARVRRSKSCPPCPPESTYGPRQVSINTCRNEDAGYFTEPVTSTRSFSASQQGQVGSPDVAHVQRQSADRNARQHRVISRSLVLVVDQPAVDQLRPVVRRHRGSRSLHSDRGQAHVGYTVRRRPADDGRHAHHGLGRITSAALIVSSTHGAGAARTAPAAMMPAAVISPPSDPPTDPTYGPCPTGCCCTCVTPTPSKPPGPRNTSAMSSARSAPQPGLAHAHADDSALIACFTKGSRLTISGRLADGAI